LTNSQWERAVTDILRLGTPPDLARTFESPVAGITDFTNNEKLLSVTHALVASYELAAETAAELATGTDAAVSTLDAGADAESFVRTFGRRAFRRPLEPAEVERYVAMFARGEALYGAGFARGASLVIRAMLQSPHFLYRTELGASGDALNGYEIASKLSFWLLGTTPSDALLDSAANGELDSPDGLEAAARQMLEQPASVEVQRDFHGQLLHLERALVVEKTGVPEYTAELNPELLETSYLFFDRIFQENLGLREILTSPVGYVGPAMAELYDVEAPAAGFELRDLGSSRRGYFGQLPFLIVNSVNRDPDSIRRGVVLNSDVLCTKLVQLSDALPPIPVLEPGQTNRERITVLTEGCGGECHGTFINPLGFAFENFDGLGQERSLDNGKPVDTSGSYPFMDGERSFAGANELVDIMAEGIQAHTCYSKKLVGYALQRDVAESDRSLLDALARVSHENSVKELIATLVKEPAFRIRAEGTP
jgi:hypothetical protein